MPAPTNLLDGVLGSKASAGGRVYEPQKSNGAILRLNLNGSFGTDDSLVLSLASFPLPKIETDVTRIAYKNEHRQFAGTRNYQNLSVSFHDYIDRATAMTLWAWSLYIHDPRTGKRGLKSVYAKNGTVDVYGPDGAEGQVMPYVIEGAWVNMLDLGDIDYTSDEPVRIQCGFAIDRMYPDPDSTIGSTIFAEVSKAQGQASNSGITASNP